MTPEQHAALRVDFPPEVIGKLPKGGRNLDFVGHAAVTDRLLSVDPEWTWEPMAVDTQGLPALDKEGNLWIRLTIAGVTRPGVGDGPDAKQRISDALRNAAMRFGVALSLWAKDGLESEHDEAKPARRKAQAPPADPAPARQAQPPADPHTGEMHLTSVADDNVAMVTNQQLGRIHGRASKAGIDHDDIRRIGCELIGRDCESMNEWTFLEGETIREHFEQIAREARAS